MPSEARPVRGAGLELPEQRDEPMTDAAPMLAPIAPCPDDPNVWSEYEIEAQTSLVNRGLCNLKHGDAFAVLDRHGDIGIAKGGAEGLFYRDTRYLSYYQLRIAGRRPLMRSSTLHEDKAALSVDLTNPDLVLDGSGKLPRDTISL